MKFYGRVSQYHTHLVFSAAVRFADAVSLMA
jgi:hypothetical protein